jgi:hypothetical protein
MAFNSSQNNFLSTVNNYARMSVKLGHSCTATALCGFKTNKMSSADNDMIVILKFAKNKS